MSDRPKKLQIIFPTTTTSSITRTTTREYFLALSDSLLDHVSINRAKKNLHLKPEKVLHLKPSCIFQDWKAAPFYPPENNFHAIQRAIA